MDTEYGFQNYGIVDIPYITIDVQGKPLNLIVDTGCGVSIITKEAVEMLSTQPSERDIHLFALTEDSLHSNTVTIPIKVNDRELMEDFVVYSKGDLASFHKEHGIIMHGILGNEFLENTKCKIDYGRHCITLY